MDNLYGILEIVPDASEPEVKKAYARLLRKYPPEKCPEEFKKIREAYETLIDPKMRDEYNARLKYGGEIDEHNKLGTEALEKKDYKKAILEFKKTLIIQPNSTYARNRLGMALLYNGDLDEAKNQFEKLVNEYPSNAVYWHNLAVTYKDKKIFDKAEQAFWKAHMLDKLSSDYIISLSDLYLEQKQYEKSITLLRKVIHESCNDKFEIFIYYFEMVTVYLVSDKPEMAQKVIEEIQAIVPEDEETKQFVAWKFANLAYKLYKAENYNLAEKMATRAMTFDPNNKEIAELHSNAVKLIKTNELMTKLINDSRIMDQVKGPLINSLYPEEEKTKQDKNVKDNLDAIQSYIDYQPQTILDSTNLLIRDYNALYQYKKELYDKIVTLSNDKIKNKKRTSNKKSSSSCFVATAAFGTPWAEEIDILRKWRDQVLVHSRAGKLFIDFYYKVGPYMAVVVEKSSILKTLVRKVVYKIIRIVEKRYSLF